MKMSVNENRFVIHVKTVYLCIYVSKYILQYGFTVNSSCSQQDHLMKKVSVQ